MTTTKEKILSANNNSNYSPTQSESYKKAEEEVKQNAIDKAEENRVNPPSFETAPRTYGDMLKQFYREKIKGEGLTPEQREKREMRLAKLQDGISAIANLIATTQGAANSFTGQNTRTESTRKKWEEFYKKREQEKRQIYEDQMRAFKLEEDIRYRNQKDEEDKRRYEEGIEFRNKQADLATQRYNKEQEEKKARQEVEDRRWQQTFDENKRQHNANIEIRKEEAKARTARGVRGKQLGFVDGSGNKVSIYENVWKGSMQQVFDAMVADNIGKGDWTDTRYKNKMDSMTAKEKDDFVKQNWHKSPKAAGIMLTLSTIDPATMTSEIKGEDASDEDYSQYEIK